MIKNPPLESSASNKPEVINTGNSDSNNTNNDIASNEPMNVDNNNSFSDANSGDKSFMSLDSVPIVSMSV